MTFEQAYAAAGKSKQGSYYKMQDMTSDICNNVTVPSESSTTTLIDTRDSNTYTVAKLKDGKCWMTQNLRISGRTITSANSDVSSSFAIPSSKTYTSWSFVEYTPNDVYIDSNNKYGGYYTWYTAVAGESTTQRTTMPHSICPKGFRLPSPDDFNQLLEAIPYDEINKKETLLDPPANFVAGGGIWKKDGYSTTREKQGGYWTSRGQNKNDNGDNGASEPLYFYKDLESRGVSNYGLGIGLNIRCVAR